MDQATERLEPDAQGLARAADLLRAGRLVAFPTETVYGLGADATDDRAVAGIFAAKNRPQFNPLIVHLAEASDAADWADLPGDAARLIAAFWPGPLTLVLPRRAGTALSPLVSAGGDSVALRVPAAPLARDLLRRTGRPVAAPSANPSGRISPTTAAHVLAGLSGRIAAILDGGPCAVGVESTILDMGEGSAPPVLLRPGGLAPEAIAAVLGVMPALPASVVGDPRAPRAPGQLSSHYAPRAPVRLNAQSARPGETLIGFGVTPGAQWSLSETGDLAEAAARLFALLHRMDAEDAGAIAVAPIPDTGLGRAINDRLRRAAAPRS